MRGAWLIPLVVLVATPLPALAEIHCPACGTKLPDDYHFCPRDGTNLDDARKAISSSPKEWPASRPTTKPAAKEPARDLTIRPAPSQDWARDLPLHLPPSSPDANPGDFVLLEWSTPSRRKTTVFLRAVLQTGKKGTISVLDTTLSWSSDAPPPIAEVLSRVSAKNSRYLKMSDYRDWARSFQIDGRPLLSPFVAGEKAQELPRERFVINHGHVTCNVVRYAITRPDAKSPSPHVIKTSQLVPFAFVESHWKTHNERLRLYSFGTIDGRDLKKLQREFSGP